MMNAVEITSHVQSMPACVKIFALNMPAMDGVPFIWTYSFGDDGFPPHAVGFWHRIAKSKWLWN